ncbi:hypothetical protein [Edaphobacter modestus]|uniref:hypothetical protein n=1 Tax=Edaphobacter modestus TaxID=388466 RepID=UPI00269D6DBB
MRSLFEAAGSNHLLHYLDIPEETCLVRLRKRNEGKPEGLYYATTTEPEFRAISKYFQPPLLEEGFNLRREIVQEKM